MKKLTTLFIAFVLLSACAGTGKPDTEESIVKYETYHNHFYDYTVEYPDFLIPQGEATNQDGQKFFSEDQKIQLLVYRDYKNDFFTGGDLYTIGEAYEEDLKGKEGIFNKELQDNDYTIEYKMDNNLHTDYALLYGENYFNIRFEYPETEKEAMKGIIEHVINTFKVEVPEVGADVTEDHAAVGGLEDKFLAFLGNFLDDCYWEKNFNSLLRGRDKTLKTYTDPKMDVKRYYAPGTVAKLGTRAGNFGFTPEDDFESKPKTDADVLFDYISNDAHPCELNFENDNIVYYILIKNLPDLVVNMQTFETKPVKTPYPNAEVMAVYLPDTFGNPRGFYFINTPDSWKLGFVDDSLCGA